MTCRLTSTFANRLDSHDTLSKRPRESELRAGALAYGRRLFIILLVLFIISFNSKHYAFAYKNHSMNLKLYAHNELKNWKQFECYVILIHHESRWDYKAKNGSHYGLGQVKSQWYRDLKPRQQIKAHLRYIEHRYSTACKALKHFEKKRWH
jgi:uncharacterized membrane protein